MYEMTLKMCSLYKGVPKGPATISFKHDSNSYLSFEGAGSFTDGLLDGDYFLCLRGDGIY
jgi:hypothetical protein